MGRHPLVHPLAAGRGDHFAGQTDEAVALARDVLRAAEASARGLVLAGALTGYGLAAFETDPAGVLDAVRRQQGVIAYAESGDRRAATTVLSVLASLLHRLGHDEAAAVVAGAGASPTVATFAEVVASIEHLRDSLGAEAFESLTARGESMETNAMFRYALQQIEEARSAL